MAEATSAGVLWTTLLCERLATVVHLSVICSTAGKLANTLLGRPVPGGRHGAAQAAPRPGHLLPAPCACPAGRHGDCAVRTASLAALSQASHNEVIVNGFFVTPSYVVSRY